MSIVLSVCGTNFSLMMSDGRMIRLNDMSVAAENFPKVKRINSKVIIGFTGDPIPTITAINSLNDYNVETLTLEEIKELMVQNLKHQKINKLGVKLIFSGKDKTNKFVTYTVDSKDNFKEIPYIFTEGFAINYALPHDSKVNIQEICDKHISKTTPWKDLNTLQLHMIECIKEISTLCYSVNDKIFAELII